MAEKLTAEEKAEIKKANRAFDYLLALAIRKNALISLEVIKDGQSELITPKTQA